jgi:hypothetical protein
MIVWSGYGILVPIITFLSLLLTQLAFDKVFGLFYYSTHRWSIGVAMIPAAVLCWLLGTYFRKLGAKTVIEKETGREIQLPGASHSFFFIPMHYCGVVLLLIGIALCIGEFFK